MDFAREAIAKEQEQEVSNHRDVRREGEKDRDIEAGDKASSESSDASSTPSLPQSGYSQGIWLTTTLDNPGIDGRGTISNVTIKVSKAPKDLEAGLNIEFEVKWDGPDDPNNPLNWSLIKKAFILTSVSMQTLMVYALSLYYYNVSQ